MLLPTSLISGKHNNSLTYLSPWFPCIFKSKVEYLLSFPLQHHPARLLQPTYHLHLCRPSISTSSRRVLSRVLEGTASSPGTVGSFANATS